MRALPNCYEWWYADAVSDDREWSIVTIFLLGNPFSSYYRLCAVGARPNPVAHNAVFLALHRRHQLHYYLFARYPENQLEVSAATPLSLRFAANHCSIGLDGALSINIKEENANRRRIQAQITICAPSTHAIQSDNDVDPPHTAHRHFWEPAIPAGGATVRAAISSPGTNIHPEHIAFTGSGYHDHNWGDLPFDGSVKEWTWARADFGRGVSAILYSVLGAGGEFESHLVLTRVDHVSRCIAATLTIHQRRLNRFGIRYPSRFSAQGDGVRVEWRFRHHVENVPFYIRYIADAAFTSDGKTTAGAGTGEYFRPRSMGHPVIAAAMDRRIYDPVAKS